MSGNGGAKFGGSFGGSFGGGYGGPAPSPAPAQAQAPADGAADGLIAAQDAAARVYQNPGLLKAAAGAAASALWKQLSDPKVLWSALKEFSGLKNFENALDPKRSLLQRIGEVGAGTFKLYGAAQMAASAASAARDAASRAFGGGKATAGALGGRGAASTAARTGVRPPNPVAPGSVVRPSAPPRPILGPVHPTDRRCGHRIWWTASSASRHMAGTLADRLMAWPSASSRPRRPGMCWSSRPTGSRASLS